MGIDLVVESVTGDLWTVQSRGYAASSTVTKADIGSFLSASATGVFAQRLLVMSTDQLARNAHPPPTWNASPDHQHSSPFDVWGRTSAQSGFAALPIALWELSLGAWLIAKGFKPSPDDAG
jgi:Mrr restriction endonuclease-like protein